MVIPMAGQDDVTQRDRGREGASPTSRIAPPVALIVACERAESNLIAGTLAPLGYDAVILENPNRTLAPGVLQRPQLLIINEDAGLVAGGPGIANLKELAGDTNLPAIVIGGSRRDNALLGEGSPEVRLARPWTAEDFAEAVATANWVQPKPARGRARRATTPQRGGESGATDRNAASPRRSTQQAHTVPPREARPEPEEAQQGPQLDEPKVPHASGSIPRAAGPDRASPRRKRFKSTLSFSASRVVTVATAAHSPAPGEDAVADSAEADSVEADNAEAETQAWGKSSGTINKRAATLKRERRGAATFLHKHTVIAERYQVLGVLGSGGMATVYRCFDQELEEDVALKLLKSNKTDATSQHRFRQEMRICRRLQHPNIVRTYEFGVWEGRRFITMEMLEGRDMAELLLLRRGALPLNQGLDLVVQAIEGLRAAHLAGVIHRDVKPHNLFVVRDTNSLKVMDFGIAKTEDMSMTVTSSAMVLGTPAYLAPERLKDKVELSAQTDLYSLGVVMYQLFTGQLPFQAPDISSLLTSIVLEDPPPPDGVNPDLPEVVVDVIMRCMHKEPRHRYMTCDQVLADIAAMDRSSFN